MAVIPDYCPDCGGENEEQQHGLARRNFCSECIKTWAHSAIVDPVLWRTPEAAHWPLRTAARLLIGRQPDDGAGASFRKAAVVLGVLALTLRTTGNVGWGVVAALLSWVIVRVICGRAVESWDVELAEWEDRPDGDPYQDRLVIGDALAILTAGVLAFVITGPYIGGWSIGGVAEAMNSVAGRAHELPEAIAMVLLFVVFASVATIIHENAHAVAADLLGFENEINYRYLEVRGTKLAISGGSLSVYPVERMLDAPAWKRATISFAPSVVLGPVLVAVIVLPVDGLIASALPVYVWLPAAIALIASSTPSLPDLGIQTIGTQRMVAKMHDQLDRGHRPAEGVGA